MDTKNSLGFALHHLGAAMDRQTDILLQEKFNIGFSQFKIMLALKNNNGVQQKQIAQFLSQTEASVSRQIKILVNMGLISSRKNPDNRRQAIATLTARGSHVTSQALTALEAHYYPIFSQLSPAQIEAFSRVLGMIHNRICTSDSSGVFGM